MRYKLGKYAVVLLALIGGPSAFSAAAAQEYNQMQIATYADLVDLADEADLVVRAQIRKQAELEPERAPNVRPGFTRLYIEAETAALISGSVPIGESLRYLVDVPLDAKGRAPKLRKQEVLLFARTPAARRGDIQLINPTAQLAWSPALEAQLRPILAELAASQAKPAITDIRDALSIAGNLAGESETQIFLSTVNDGLVSLTVIRRPGQAPMWGVSWSDIVDQAARPPQKNTLEWYRLACFLPATLPPSANLASDSQSKMRAEDDYRFILERLGPCPRNRA
ncbi:hypothetical protein [Pontixanthobacter sp.]|uniref:hypothetical protein n=1 Tax=Pontixanthobacter sp. TaxID=2792078 RepID=UPI003C7A33C1